jgi:hypothetical protein
MGMSLHDSRMPGHGVEDGLRHCGPAGSEADGVFTLDLSRGAPGEIARVDGAIGSLDVSFDGWRVAMAIRDGPEAAVEILPLAGKPQREIVLKSWPSLNSMDWSL